MKIKKILLILFILITLSGCTVESNVIMDEYGKVKEEVKVLIPSKDISNKKDRIDSYVKTAINSYEAALNAVNYKYDIINDVNNKSGALIYNEFDNVCSFIQNTVFSQYLYKRIDCNESEYFYEIKSSSEHIPYCADCNAWPALDDVKLKITLPISADENNADEVEKNTYTWKYNESTSSDKGIYLKISKAALEQKKIEADKKKANNKKIDKSLGIIKTIVIIGLIFVGIGFVMLKGYKKYKSNKLEY